jgi:hypothetical protein
MIKDEVKLTMKEKAYRQEDIVHDGRKHRMHTNAEKYDIWWE